MRLTRQLHKPSLPELNMAAMIDVVFLLMIYFLLTLVFIDPERSLFSQLPNIGQKQSEIDLQDFEPVHVRLVHARPSDNASAVKILCDGQTVADYAALVAALKQRRAIADVPVVIEGQDTVPFDFMARALDACHQADLHKVAFSAKGGR